MILDIKELNFPNYATLESATVTLADMGERTITAQVKIDGDITPDFSFEWEVEYKGEKYIMPLRKPQASKENTSLDSVVDLTFQHWVQYQLKRWYFFTIQPVESGTAVPDKYIASVNLNLGDFCTLFNKILNYYFGGKIRIDLNENWQYDKEPSYVELNYSHLWDVLIKLYEVFAVRWDFERYYADGNPDDYIIKVGYPTKEQNHILKYGFDGGLLKVERQVQSDEIANILLGRGGEKNLPYRYFKNVDPNNPTFPADPDWIKELKDIHFNELRGATFRSYIQGWKAAHDNEYSGYAPLGMDKAYSKWAYLKGYNDDKFDPVEYVADEIELSLGGGNKIIPITPTFDAIIKKDSSIYKYGPIMNGVDNNEDIYPSIKGRSVDPIGRLDEVVDVEKILSDDVIDATENDAAISNVSGCSTTIVMNSKERKSVEILGGEFEVPTGQYADFDDGVKSMLLTKDAIKIHFERVNGHWTISASVEKRVMSLDGVEIEDTYIRIYNTDTNEEISPSGIPEGKYKYVLQYKVYNGTEHKLNVTVSVESPKLVTATLGDNWKQTWNIWIKNIWSTTQFVGETDTEYAERVWKPILGDHLGEDAKIVFYDGMLSTSEDYEFVIVKMPEVDNSKTINDVNSHWKLTLAKCDADLESTGDYVPSTKRNGEAGDHFFFTGIELPHLYITLSEIELDNYKKDILNEKKEIRPTWVVTTDRVRFNSSLNGEKLIEQIHIGDSIRLSDNRFIDGDYETLYVSSITHTYRKPSSTDNALNPDVELVLSDRYSVSANPINTIQGKITAISKQIGSISNVEQIVRSVGDKLYLRKDGIAEKSISPTEYSSLLTSTNFRNGIVGGAGWGFFKGSDGAWILETDRINVRQSFQVNSIVINQIVARGGMIIESAAQLEIERIEEDSTSYRCYFNQKNGTVVNLFHPHDIAYCSRFNSDGSSLKYYKMEVSKVDEMSISLSKTIAIANGIPEVGDTIVHFGNYVDTNRQFVKIRDVVGGGYERYIGGLDSVTSEGYEYYFVGRQSGAYGNKPRCFIGGLDNYIKYENDTLKIKAAIDIESTVGDKNILDAVNDNIEIGGTNLALKSDTENFINILPPKYYYSLSETIKAGTEITITIWGDDTLNEGVPIRFTTKDNRILFFINKVGDRKWKASTILDEDVLTFGLKANTGPSKSITVHRVKIELGNIGTDWSPAPQDIEATYGYLKNALSESTSISGGLITTSHIQLGYTNNDVYTTTAGISGLYKDTADGGGIAFWAGSNIADNYNTAVIDGSASFVVRMDGTGYMANNTVKFTENELIIGSYLHLTPSEMYLKQSSGNVAFSAKDAPTGYSPTSGEYGGGAKHLQYKIRLTNNWYGDCNHRSVFASVFKAISIPIGTIGAGGKISISIKSTFKIKYDTPTPFMQNAGSVLIKLVNTTSDVVVYENEQRAWSMKQSEDSDGRTVYTYSMNLTDATFSDTAGTFKLLIQGVDTFDKEGWDYSSSALGESPIFDIEINTENKGVRQTIIGNDGFASSWEDSLFCVTKDGLLLKYKDKYIRFDNNGISYKTSNDGEEKKLI